MEIIYLTLMVIYFILSGFMFLDEYGLVIYNFKTLGYLTSIFLTSYWVLNLIHIYFINKITPTDD